MKSNFVSIRWEFVFLFVSFLVRKIPFAGIELMARRVKGLRGTSELPGRPAFVPFFYAPLFLGIMCDTVQHSTVQYSTESIKGGGLEHVFMYV